MLNTNKIYYSRSVNFGKSLNLKSWIHVLSQLLFTTSETELDYCQQTLNVRGTSRVTNDLKLKISGNFKNTPDMLGPNRGHPAGLKQGKFRHLSKKIVKN